MKRIFLPLLILFCISFPSAFSEDWSDYSSAGSLWEGQKSITNDEFEKAIETLQGTQKQKEEKQKKKKIKKIMGGGTSLHPGLDPMSEIQAQEPLKQNDNEGQLVNIPVKLFVGDATLDVGFYNIFGEKDKNGDVYLSFYQAHSLMGKVKASETKHDFDSESINFAKMIPYNEDYVQIVFGSLDFNAYVFLRYEEDNKPIFEQ